MLTKEDEIIASLKALNERIDSLDTRIDSLNQKVDLNAVRMMEFFAEMYDKLKAEINDVRTELKKDINDLRLEMKEDHKLLYYEAFKAKNSIDDYEVRISDLEDEKKSN